MTKTSRQHRVEPKLPHERDESTEPGAPVNDDARRVGQQAARDLARGLVDTGLGPVLQDLTARHFAPPAEETAAQAAALPAAKRAATPAAPRARRQPWR
jgi:hypothetical protein